MIVGLALALLAVPVQMDMYDVDVTECYDGDTCTINIYLGFDLVLKNQKVRLCDINAPEIRPLKSREAAQKAKDRLVELISSAGLIRLGIPGLFKRDSFGRILGYLYADGINLSHLLLKEGLVNPFKKSCWED